MANLHDIERRINSVSSTKQITRTMEMVAAAKIRRATDRALHAAPWSVAVSDMLITTAPQTPIDTQPLLQVHDEIKKGIAVVITSDRGLAGGFNSNVLRGAEIFLQEKKHQGIDTDVIACGKKAIGYFSYRGIKPVMEFAGLSADPTYEEAVMIARFLMNHYVDHSIDEITLIYNHAKNAAEQRLIEQKVLPLDYKDYEEILGLRVHEDDVFDAFREKDDTQVPGDIDFEPDAQSVMSNLLTHYMVTTVYFALMDSAAAEQGARRNAMKSATDNANEMVATLTRVYNRARQGAITTEINEIVGGAAALEDE